MAPRGREVQGRVPDLVDVVRCLGEHPSATDAFDACEIDERRRPAFDRALQALAASDFLQPVAA